MRDSNSYNFTSGYFPSPEKRSHITTAVLTHLDTQGPKNMPEFKGPKLWTQSHGRHKARAQRVGPAIPLREHTSPAGSPAHAVRLGPGEKSQNQHLEDRFQAQLKASILKYSHVHLRIHRVCVYFSLKQTRLRAPNLPASVENTRVTLIKPALYHNSVWGAKRPLCACVVVTIIMSLPRSQLRTRKERSFC